MHIQDKGDTVNLNNEEIKIMLEIFKNNKYKALLKFIYVFMIGLLKCNDRAPQKNFNFNSNYNSNKNYHYYYNNFNKNYHYYYNK